MKTLIVFTMLFTATALTTHAQKIAASKVPMAVKAAFAKQYPGTTAKWENEKGSYEAGFTFNGQSMSALYNANGTPKETEVAIKVAALPAPVLDYIKAHYTNKRVKEAAKITKADGTINYEAEINGTDVLFDANGKFLKEVKD